MNLASWLERAGLSHGALPAIALGARVVRSYGELAQRAARLAGALETRFGLAPGDRVAIFAKSSPDYIEVLNAIWHAGLAAVPVNAKLHGRELAYILEQSGEGHGGRGGDGQARRREVDCDPGGCLQP